MEQLLQILDWTWMTTNSTKLPCVPCKIKAIQHMLKIEKFEKNKAEMYLNSFQN